MLRLIILSLMLVVVTWFNRSGNEKSSLSEPSLIQLTMNMSAWDGSENQKLLSSTPSFQIDSGSLSVSNLAFHGIRQNGKEFQFSTSMSRSFTLENKSLPLSILEFDVPKGNYQSANLILHANGQDSLPAMTLKGRWNPENHSRSIPMEIRFFHFPQVFSLPLSHSGASLHFPSNGVSTLQIHVQPDLILRALQQVPLQDITLSPVSSGNKLIISRRHNPLIHAALITRAEKSIKAYIQ